MQYLMMQASIYKKTEKFNSRIHIYIELFCKLKKECIKVQGFCIFKNLMQFDDANQYL